MWLAFDTSGDHASVALGWPGRVLAEESIAGRRRQAGGLLPAIDRILRYVEGGLESVEGVLVTDGPGSFTGLRIGAATAKALVLARHLELWTAPSLLVQGAAALEERSGRVLAIADALRGEIYAAEYLIEPGGISTILEPGVFTAGALAGRDPPDLIAGRPRGELASVLAARQGSGIVPVVEAQPAASTLLALMGRSGGLRRIPANAVARWEPYYGRPAAAQAEWERTHGRTLGDPARPA